MVGAGGVIDTQGFSASTLDVADGQFMAGGDLNFVGDSSAKVENLGTIDGADGGVFLIARQVENKGTLTAEGGTAAMAAGSEVLLKPAGSDSRIAVLAGRETGGTGVYNSGMVQSARAELKAAGGNAYALAIHHDENAVVSATTMVNEGGQIWLRAGTGGSVEGGKVQVDGKLSATGETGGDVHVLGEEVYLGSTAQIDVSGEQGGGEVLVGGDFQGSNPDVPNAQFVTAEVGSEIRTDATVDGDGGKVIVWSDNTTEFHGEISATGKGTGDGGFAEVSGKQHLTMTGHADLSSENGDFGELLLDPGTVIIDDNSGSGGVDTFGDDWITTQLGLGDVTIQTSAASGANGANEDVIFNANTNITWSATTKFEVIAGRTITLNSGVVVENTSTGFSGADQAIVFRANEGGVATGDNTDAIYLNNAQLISNTGNIYLIGQAKGDGGNYNIGIYIYDGAQIQSTGTGVNAATITLNGTGGDGVLYNRGIFVYGAGVANPRITSIDGDIILTGQGGGDGSGSGNAGILLWDGVQITSTGTTTNAAKITLNGTGGEGGGSNGGFVMHGQGGNSTYVTSVMGDINITGLGGNGNSSENSGIYILSNSYVSSTGMGVDAATITLNGTGGNGTSTNYGVIISTASVTAVDGNIDILGQGGVGSANRNYGIFIGHGAQVVSSGTGTNAATITLDGTGGSGTLQNYGVCLYDSGSQGTLVTSVDGDISITAQAGDGDSNNVGLFLYVDAQISSTGTGADAASITINSTGGGGTGDNYGSYLFGSDITSADGDISIITQAGETSGYGIRMYDSSQISSSGSGDISITSTGTGTAGIYVNTGSNTIGHALATGNITLSSDTMSLGALSIQSSGDLLVQPLTASETIGLGDGATGTLNLNNAELGMITAGFNQITFGRTDSSGDVDVHGNALAALLADHVTIRTPGTAGDIVIDGTANNISWAGTTKLELIAGRTITMNSGSVIESTSVGFTGTERAIYLNANQAGTASGDFYGITMSGASLSSNTGNIELIGAGGDTGDDNYGINLDLTSSITSTGTGADAATITLNGTGGSGGIGHEGMRVKASITSVDGDISLTGQGGSSVGAYQRGVYVASGANISSTGTGADAATITINGTGGSGSHYCSGIFMYGGTTRITSVEGNIELIGVAGGSNNSNTGIRITQGAQVISTGTGVNAATITIQGTGGHAASGNHGVYIENADSKVTSTDGDISVTGIGGNGSSTNNVGVFLHNGGQITSTGTGVNAATITIDGTGGNGTNTNYGFYIDGNAGANTYVTSVDGAIDITGQGGSAATGDTNHGVYLYNGGIVESTDEATITITGIAGAGTSVALVTSTGTNVIGSATAIGNITLSADTISLANLSIQSSGDLLIQPRTTTTTIGLGGGAGTLNFWMQRSLGLFRMDLIQLQSAGVMERVSSR